MVKSWTTTPKRAKILEAEGLPAVVVLWQHWTGPVLQDEAGSSLGTGVATARIAREVMIASLENIVGCVVAELRVLRCSTWGVGGRRWAGIYAFSGVKESVCMTTDEA